MSDNFIETFDLNEGTEWRWFQWGVVQLHRATRYLTFLCSRQHGKTRYGVELIMDFIFRYKKRQNPLVIVTMPTAEQVYDVWFVRLHHKLVPVEGILYTKQGSRGSALSMTIHRTWLEKPDYVTIEFHGSGNPKALKGRTADLIVGDEMAFVPQTFWTQVLEPMLDDTGGKALLTSTINGHNWFAELCDGHKEMMNHHAAHIEFNPLTAQLRTDEWIKTKEDYARRTNGWQDYLREYWHDRTAASYEEAPFSFYCSMLRKRGQFQPMNEFIMSNVINVSVDLGKSGNNAAWYWIMANGQPFIIDYRDDHFNNYELLDELPKKYKGKVFNVIYPCDINQPAVLDGYAQKFMLEQHITKNGYGRLININDLPKTPNKKALIECGVELLSTAKFLEGSQNISRGLQKLSGCVHPKDKDGIIDPSKFKRNNLQHAGDAWCYLWAALSQGLQNDLSYEQRLNLDSINNFEPVKQLETNYRGVKIC